MPNPVFRKFMPLAEVHHLPMQWTQVGSLPAKYELRAGEAKLHLIAEIVSDGILKNSVTVRTMEGTWQFQQRGFFKMQTVALQGQTAPALVMNREWNGGTVALPTGQHLKWQSLNLWGSKWGFLDTLTGERLIEYQCGGFLKWHATMKLMPSAVFLPNALMLITMGWYQILLHQMESAAVVVMAG